MASFDDNNDKSLLDKLDNIAPIREFDAFPKVATSYTKRTTLGALATLVVIGLSFLLSLNDVGEFLWGWPDYEYAIDRRYKDTLKINLDMVVNMPCGTLSVDVRDAAGDRLHMSNGFRRDGTTFDAKQAHRLSAHGKRQSTAEIVTAAKKRSGGLFAALQAQSSSEKIEYAHYPSGDACRIYGTVEVKRVTGKCNLHITTLGHGYSSREHVDHKLINLTHVINEFSFGPYFPNIAQPLDYTYEVADEPFSLFQYFIQVVPTVYHAPRSKPVRTNQYSVNSYRRNLIHGRGTPGIFFKYDIDPIEMTVYQRTHSLPQFLLRLCGVVGGVWVCAQWALKITAKAATVVVGKDNDDQLVVDDSRMRKSSISKRWAGGELRARATGPSGWTIDGASPYSASFGSYSSTPTMAVNGYPMSPNGYPPTPMNGGYPRTPINANGLAPAQVPLPSTPLPPSTPGPHGSMMRPQLSLGQTGQSLSPSPSSPLSPYVHVNGSGSPSPVQSRPTLSPRVDKRMD
ncbi:hypothetical protein FRC01_003659 [Tulasnella sp. 417]|nr:hypothetical protein FRC01_003659 [Tulasnella sp. 417]